MRLNRIVVAVLLLLVVAGIAQAEDVKILLRHEMREGKSPGTTFAAFHESGLQFWAFNLQSENRWIELGYFTPVVQNDHEYLDLGGGSHTRPTGIGFISR